MAGPPVGGGVREFRPRCKSRNLLHQAPSEGKAGRSRTYAERFVPTIGASGNKVGTRKPNEINVFPLFPLFPHKKRQPEGERA